MKTPEDLKQLRMEIIQKNSHRICEANGLKVLFDYHAAMEEYAELYHSQFQPIGAKELIEKYESIEKSQKELVEQQPDNRFHQGILHSIEYTLYNLRSLQSETVSDAVEFSDWTNKNRWKFGGNGKIKHEGFWIQFHGRGSGYSKETTKNLYEIFLLTNK